MRISSTLNLSCCHHYLAKNCLHVYHQKLSVTDGKTDDGQSDPYVALCFVGGVTINLTLTNKCIIYTIIALGCHCHTAESYLKVREPGQISFFSQTNTS